MGRKKKTTVEILETAQKVCTTWRSVCKDPSMWRVIGLSQPTSLIRRPFFVEELQIMCRQAVDRSQGQLSDIYIGRFGSHDLLLYISERSSQLRFLRITFCNRVSGGGLSEAAKKFPLLEKLHLIHTENVRDYDIEAIGKSCPLLWSFIFDVEPYKNLPSGDENYAHAVAKTMPNLRHFRFFGSNMANEGLLAVLDGCPLLESLDLRQCYNLDLSGALGKRCSKQIKHLRLPHDSIDDYKWWSTEEYGYSEYYYDSEDNYDFPSAYPDDDF